MGKWSRELFGVNGPPSQNLFFLVTMEGAMTPSKAYKYGYSA